VTNPRPARRSPILAGLLAGLAVVGSGLPAVGRGAGLAPEADGPSAPSAVIDSGSDTSHRERPLAGTGDLRPSIHHDEAIAHEADRIDFQPGDRVTVGFQPRAGNTWPVGGRRPRALPAGNANGREILGSRNGSTWSVQPPIPIQPAPAALAPVDGEILGGAALAPARSAVASRASDQVSVAPGGNGLLREVFGFLPYWELSDNSTALRYDRLSTIAYFGVGVDGGGNLIKTDSDGTSSTGWSGWASARLTNVINAAHQHGTRVVLTLQAFAWTTNQANKQAALLGSEAARLNLARQAAAAVRDRGADGINLDFEPIVSGYADAFTALVRTIRAELDAIAPGYQLTFDTTGWIGNYPIAEATAPGGADAIFIMGYDYRNGSASTSGSISPLTGPAYDLTDTIAAYTARVPASKLILGVPWYGRAWSTATDGVRSENISSSTNGTSVAVMYPTAVGLAAEHGRRYDPVEQTPWTVYRKTTCNSGCVTTWRQLYYDDVESLAAKYDFVNRSGLRGVGIWALGYDDNRTELQALLADKFLRDSTPPKAGIRALPSTTGSREFQVSWTGLDDGNLVNYDVDASVDGGSWLRWLTGTTVTSAGYTGAPGRAFAFRVRATDSAGNVGPWLDGSWSASPALQPGGFGRVEATSLNVRSAPSTSATIVGTATSSTLVAVTGGPVAADGYTWYQVTLPIQEWGPVSPVTSEVWIAAGTSSTPYVVAVQAPNATTVDADAPSPAGARYMGLAPVRLLDTRYGNGLAGPFSSGAVRAFQIAGRGGVPANAVAVTGTVTTTGSTGAGWVTVGPSTGSTPATSTLNFPRGDDRAAGVTVALGSGGTLSAVFQGLAGGTTQLIFDVTGAFVPGSDGATFVPLIPARVLDSRVGNGLSEPFRNATPRTLQVGGRGGVAGDAVAVSANVTITRQTSAGYLAVGPTVSATPSTSILNAPHGDDRATGTTVPLGPGGTLQAVWIGSPGSTVDVIVDVTGYFVEGGNGASYFELVPVRLLDTRIGNGLAGAFQDRAARSFPVSARGTIPVDAVAISGTVTMTGQTSNGYLSVGPPAAGTPTASTLNAPRGDTRANGVNVRLGPGGSLAGFWAGASGSTAHVILDATGYFR
jgi:spore germination protein YaaH